MPAEFEKHSAVWLVWPTDDITFINRLPKAQEDMAKIIKNISESEQVELLVLNEDVKKLAEDMLNKEQANLAKINFHITEYVDVWIRDYGPTFVLNSSTKTLALVSWGYNAYGKANEWYFEPLDQDAKIPKWMNGYLKLPSFEPGIVLEGGAIDVNGQGVCLTTQQCLLNPNRNPEMTKERMEKYLGDYLNVKKTIWLKEGLTNDHTDGHIDEIARFANATTIVCAFEDDKTDENYPILLDNYNALVAATDVDGKPFKVIKLPMPHMKYTEEEKIKYEEGDKAPVSYANFYIGNTVVLAPTFNDPNDEKAMKILQDTFQDRKVIPIACEDLIYGGGVMHCMSQQQPAV